MIKVALLLSMGAVGTAKHHKNSNLNLYNQFLFCNRILLFRRYLHSVQEGHGGQEVFFFDLLTPCFRHNL